MRIVCRLMAVGAVAIVLVVTAGCGANKPATTPPASRSASDSATASDSPSASTTSPAWAKKYSASQLGQYRQALATWKAYQHASAPIWATGRVTPEAKRIFERYWYTPDLMLNLLRTYQHADAHLRGYQRVLSSKATLIKPGVVRIHQCVDGSRSRFVVGGERKPGVTHPFKRQISVDRSRGESWRILRLQDPSVGWTKSCAG